jgi:hypothetical protein
LFAQVAAGLTLPRPDGKDHFDSPRRFNPTGVRADLGRLLLSAQAECAKLLE